MSLAQKLRDARPERFEVACLPDFFVDVVVPMAPWPVSRDQMEAIAARKGGNLPTAPHRVSQGGNAANCALALARLGVRSHLLARTSKLGLRLANEFLEPGGVDLSRLRPDGEMSSTVALEFGPERRNVMLSFPGSVAEFAPEDLEDKDWAVIADGDAVLVSNWGLNRAGTALAEAVLRGAGQAGTLAVFDSGDPSARAPEVQELFDRVLASPRLGVLCCNENEIAHFARAAGDDRSEDLRSRARSVRGKVRATVDVHTRSEALSLGPDGRMAEVPTGKAEGRRATGAGDAWNAGNILGHLLALPAGERLRLANTVAECYVTAQEPVHPTLEQVARAIEAQR